MLVSRHHDSEQNSWSKSKYETSLHSKSTPTPRMSHHYDAPLSTQQSSWQGQQYSYLPPGHSSVYSQSSYEHGHQASPSDAEAQAQPRSAADASGSMDIDSKSDRHTLSPSLSHRRSEDPSTQRQLSPNQGEMYAQKAAEEGFVTSAASNTVSSVSSAGQVSDVPSHTQGDDQVKQEDDEELLDDDDLDGEGDGITAEMTPAERTAARRKMKRFRLTHQQTRFLMSEFAKQPHPDAAHRERLSREIPGLSPRQVQVWFQNRRAKIKRLTADDRERMIKMRAVPDDFDNVQALHSPYGAVHGLGTPMGSPVGFGPGGYPDHMMRSSLVVDVRRPEGGDAMSSTGLSPAFNGIGFSSSTSMSNPDLMASPMPHESGDRYEYSGQLTPMSGGPRTSNPFTRQTSLDGNSIPMHSRHSRQPAMPIQPLQLRETLNRSRSDTLNSPLRSSMSWKGDAIDYTSYQAGGGSSSPQPLSGRAASVYHPQEPTTLGGYESSSYAASAVASPAHMGYPNFQSNSFLNSQQNRSRLRAASATLPLGLDLSGQRSSYAASQQPAVRSATSPTLHPRNSHHGQHHAATSAPYTSSFPTAPLTAPSDFHPRTPSFAPRSNTSSDQYAMPQMSAPIAPSNEFAQAFQSMGPSASARTPMRDSFMPADRGHDDYSGATGGELRKKPGITVTVTRA